MELLHFLALCVVLKLAGGTERFPSLNNAGISLSRRKRYVVFPQGSTFSISFCMSFKDLGSDDIFTGGMNFQVSYKLPNETIHENNLQFPPPVLLRRHRRDVYEKLEIVFNSVGVDGRACMLRTLCEAAQQLEPNGSLISELLRIIFTLPLERVHSSEPAEHHQYDAAHRGGLAERDCPSMFPNCPLSVLDMALGAHRTT